MDDATPEQARWFRRLRRCIADMPDDTAVLVRHGSIEMIEPSARDEAFARYGQIDNCEVLDSFPVSGAKVEPAGEGL